MTRVKKNNRIVDVDRLYVDSYLKEGYDQIDTQGNIIKRATGGKIVSIQEHNRVLDELSKLKKSKILNIKESSTKLEILKEIKKKGFKLKGWYCVYHNGIL